MTTVYDHSKDRPVRHPESTPPDPAAAKPSGSASSAVAPSMRNREIVRAHACTVCESWLPQYRRMLDKRTPRS